MNFYFFLLILRIRLILPYALPVFNSVPLCVDDSKNKHRKQIPFINGATPYEYNALPHL